MEFLLTYPGVEIKLLFFLCIPFANRSIKVLDLPLILQLDRSMSRIFWVSLSILKSFNFDINIVLQYQLNTLVVFVANV